MVGGLSLGAAVTMRSKRSQRLAEFLRLNPSTASWRLKRLGSFTTTSLKALGSDNVHCRCDTIGSLASACAPASMARRVVFLPAKDPEELTRRLPGIRHVVGSRRSLQD